MSQSPVSCKQCEKHHKQLRTIVAELKGLHLSKDAERIKRLKEDRAGAIMFLANNCPDYLAAKRLKKTADKQVEL